MSFRDNLRGIVEQALKDIANPGYTFSRAAFPGVTLALRELDNPHRKSAAIKVPRHHTMSRDDMLATVEVLSEYGYDVFDVNYDGNLNVKSFRIRFAEVY